MLLSRFRRNKKPEDENNNKNNKKDKNREDSDDGSKEGLFKRLNKFLEKRDYMGAISLLEHKMMKNEKNNSKNNDEQLNLKLWLGYCHFHAANYRNAKSIYEQMLGDKHCPNEVYLYLGCSFFFLGLYENAKKVAEKGEKS
uniref:TPR_REGION domain-containing protein n=1 Tax=Meloidogyne hapla TaxID=6305 RepID=A0A1I8BXS7_MELHA